MPVTKSKTPRTTLASQIDRLDRTLDGLADALPEVVAEAVRTAVAVALREAIQNAVAEALANPETIESFRQAVQPVQPVQPVTPVVEVTLPEPIVTPPSRFARFRGNALTVALISQVVGPFAASLLAGMSGFGVAVLASPAPIA